MACPQKENGFTPIANEVLDKIILYQFPKNTSSAPKDICFFVIRKTWGYHKKVDKISITQFEKSTGYPRPTIVHWLGYLVKAKLLLVDKTPSRVGYSYGFNKDYDQWLPLVKAKQLVKARKFTSKVALTATSKVALTHKRKKESTKENIANANFLSIKSKEMKTYNEKNFSDDGEVAIDIETGEISSPTSKEKKPKETQPHIKLAIAYVKSRKFEYKNEKDYWDAVFRYMKPAAKLLRGHKGVEILDCMKWCEKKYPEWSLETVQKKIDEYKTYAK